MSRSVVAVFVGLLTFGLSAMAWAQDDMSFGLDDAEGTDDTGAQGGGETGADMTFGEGDASDSGGGADEGAGEGEGEGAGDIIGDLAGGDDGGLGQEERAVRSTETVEEIYAVQQVYALRINRVELSPSIGFTLNDPYVSHPSGGLALNYWWTNVLAVGLNFLWYQALETESDLNFDVRRSTRLAVPITEYQLGAHLNFTYVPLYGKFMMFNEYIFQWDAYLVGGIGMMRTRPVPVIDPEIRQFDFDWRVAFNVGIGIRVFITRYLAVFGELRDYAYLERLENLDVALREDRSDPATWLDTSPSLTNNVTAHLGFTLFFPFTFEYRLPK